MIKNVNGKNEYCLPLTLNEFKDLTKNKKCFYLCAYNSEEYLDRDKQIDCPEAYRSGFISIIDHIIWLVNYYEKKGDDKKLDTLMAVVNKCMTLKKVYNIDVIEEADEQNELLYGEDRVEVAVNKDMEAYILGYHHNKNEYYIVESLYNALYKIESGKKQLKTSQRNFDNMYKDENIK